MTQVDRILEESSISPPKACRVFHNEGCERRSCKRRPHRVLQFDDQPSFVHRHRRKRQRKFQQSQWNSGRSNRPTPTYSGAYLGPACNRRPPLWCPGRWSLRRNSSDTYRKRSVLEPQQLSALEDVDGFQDFYLPANYRINLDAYINQRIQTESESVANYVIALETPMVVHPTCSNITSICENLPTYYPKLPTKK